MSPARGALIHALTLQEDEALGEAGLDEVLGAVGAEALAGEVRLAQDDPVGNVFETVRLAVRLSPESIGLALEGRLRPQWRARLAGLAEGVETQELMSPPGGLLAVSGNLGKPLGEVWKGLEDALGPDIAMSGLLAQYGEDDGTSHLPFMLEQAGALLAGLGPKWAVSWVNVDQRAMVPMPEFVALAQGDAGPLREAFQALPPPPPDVQPWTTFPRYDAEAGVVRVPMIGGPSLEPTLGVHGNALLLSSSRNAAERLLAKQPDQKTLQGRGNLYVRVLPYPCLSAAAEAGHQFADFGLIRGHTPETFQAMLAPWLARARAIRDIYALVALSDGRIAVDAALQLGETP